MANGGKTRVYCAYCGEAHRLTPSAMAIVIEAFQDGELQKVESGGRIHPVCILTALSTMDVLSAVRRYRGSIAWQT